MVARAPAAAIVAASSAPGDGRDFVAAPFVYLHGRLRGEVTAELSDGHIKWVNRPNAYAVRNLVNRLFSGKPDVGGRLVRLGCLFPDPAREGFLGDTFAGTGLPPGDRRTPMQAQTDRRVFESIVRMAKYCAAFRLNVACTRAVVAQALHVAERGNHQLVDTVLSAMRNDYEKHTVSATWKGTKMTMAKYADDIRQFCVRGGENLPVDACLLPLSRHSVVMFLQAEASRRLTRRGSARGAPPSEGEDDNDNDDGSDSVMDASDTEAPDAGAASGLASPAKRPRRPDGGGGPSSAPGAVGLARLKPPVRSAGAFHATFPDCSWRRGAQSREFRPSRVCIVSGDVSLWQRSRPRLNGGWAVGLRPMNRPGAGGGRLTSAAEAARGLGRLVSHHTVVGGLNALAKVANMCSPLWRFVTCACCRKWLVAEYESAGSFHAAAPTVERRKRDRLLQETSAGSD